ncbi:MAG: threonylcarbamoyl-AMP synthase [Ignavibacteria bacterium]
MRTRVLLTSPAHRQRNIALAAALIRRGELVAFPTETVYGLGANALDARAVKKIFWAKGRPSDNPLIVHLFDVEQLPSLVRSIPDTFWKLAHVFVPGPLTFVLPRAECIPDVVTAGLPSVGVRFPHHPIARALLKAARVPIAAPSANLSGKPSPTRAEHVIEDLDGRIAAVLAAGRCEVGLESTVLDLTVRPPVILRPGAVTRFQIERVLGVKVLQEQTSRKRPRSPGMKYKHYAPAARVVFIEGKMTLVIKEMVRVARMLHEQGFVVGLMCAEKWKERFASYKVFSLGNDVEDAARRLFDGFRALDAKGVDVILCHGYAEEGMGMALMNRLRKAASQWVRV